MMMVIELEIRTVSVQFQIFQDSGSGVTFDNPDSGNSPVFAHATPVKTG